MVSGVASTTNPSAHRASLVTIRLALTCRTWCSAQTETESPPGAAVQAIHSQHHLAVLFGETKGVKPPGSRGPPPCPLESQADGYALQLTETTIHACAKRTFSGGAVCSSHLRPDQIADAGLATVSSPA